MASTDHKNVYLASKPRYEILDGLRGIAAMLVVAYHLFETYYGGKPDQPINHGYLAVDFFFVLSGFVIGYAYDDRWNNMSTWAFFKRRLIRLHPMVIFGTLFGALMFYFGSCSTFPLINEIVIVLAMPWMGLGTEGAERWTNGLYEAFCIIVCFPLIVAMGAGSSVMGRSKAINQFLGEISYPLYITHYPLIYMQMSWLDSHKDAPLSTHIFVAVCIFTLAILVAYGSYKLYDLPVREWLKKKWFTSSENTVQ